MRTFLILVAVLVSAAAHADPLQDAIAQGRDAEGERLVRAGLKAAPPPEKHEALLASLAGMLVRDGRKWEADEALRQLIAFREARHGAQHPSVGLAWATLGSLYSSDEPFRFTASRRAFERAHAILVPLLQPPVSARTYEVLVLAAGRIGPYLQDSKLDHCRLRQAQIAQIEKEQGRASRALIEPLTESASFCSEYIRGAQESHYLRAREIAARDSGEVHADVIYVDEQLENFYASREYDQERNQRRAAEIRQRILRLKTQLYGKDSAPVVSERLARYLDHVSDCRFSGGECQRRLDGFVAEYARSTGAQYPGTAMKMRAIARAAGGFSSSGETERDTAARTQYVVSLHQRTLDLLERIYSRDHPEWALQRAWQAEFLGNYLQQHSAGADALAQAVPVYRKYYGANDEATMDLAKLGVIYMMRARRNQDALKLAKEAVDAFDEGNPWGVRGRLAEMLQTLGDLQAQAGRAAEAEASLQRSLRVLAASGDLPERQAAVAKQLTNLYRAQGASDKAARMETLSTCLAKTDYRAKPQCGAYP